MDHLRKYRFISNGIAIAFMFGYGVFYYPIWFGDSIWTSNIKTP